MTGKYQKQVAPRLSEIEAWAVQEVPREEILKRLGVSETSFRRYRKEYPELEKALSLSEDSLDRQVLSALHKNAVGFSFTEQQAVKVKDTEYTETGRKLSESERVEVVEVERFKPGDVSAQKAWLSLRGEKDGEDDNDTRIVVEIGGEVQEWSS